jgi:hypothetical protein
LRAADEEGEVERLKACVTTPELDESLKVRQEFGKFYFYEKK